MRELTLDLMKELRHLTSTQIKVVVALMDCQGHCLRELAETLGKDAGNLQRAIRPMLKMGIIEKAPPRPTTNPFSLHPGKHEVPYLLVAKANVFDSIWYTMFARIHELSAEEMKIRSTAAASGIIPDSRVRRVDEIEQEKADLMKRMEGMLVLSKNLELIIYDRSEYVATMNEVGLTSFTKPVVADLVTSFDL
jgi:predicted ribosome quality control (RQC) complex YloA/Tae2 family protein